jgi:N-acetylneuraminic acid mutarotase
LPTGALGNVTVTDPNGHQTLLTSSQTITAVSGNYTVTAAPVIAGNSTYSPTLATQTVVVTTGNTANAAVDYYTVVPTTTKVLDSIASSGLAVSSDGLTLTLPASSPVAQSLEAGDMIVVPPTSANGIAPMGMLRKVVSISSSNSQIIATTLSGRLADAFQRVNFQIQSKLTSATIRAVHSAPGVVFRRGASLARPSGKAFAQASSQPPTDPCGGYSLGVFDVTEPMAISAVPGLTLNGSIEICSGLNFNVDIVGTGFINLVPAVNSLTATASMGEFSDLTLQGSILSGSFSPDPTTLATLDFPPVAAPGLPIWVTPKVSVFVGANGNISSSISTEVSSSGTFTGGVTYALGAWSPVPLAASFQSGYQPPTLNASLSAKAYAGIEFDLYVYDVVGPSFKPDIYLDLEADIAKNPWWTLDGGIEGPMSLDVTFLGENLASYDLGTLFDYSYPIISATGPFIPPVNNPVPTITGLNPISLAAGATPQTLTINGTGFLSSSKVAFNGISHTAAFLSATHLTISLTSTDLATAGTYPVVVTNPAPGGGASVAKNFIVTNGQTANEWRWMSGANTGNQAGVYGALGAYAAGNMPGAHYISVGWTDAGGHLWLFGGQGYDSVGNWDLLNDLWEYDPASGDWRWMSGGSKVDSRGVYGALGVDASGNVPGARYGHVSWTDAGGHLWFFGGWGYDSASNAGVLNDLWEYDPASGEWRWMSGSSTVGSAGVYGAQGAYAAGNVPSAHYESVSWSDAGGHLWLFGGQGQGHDSTGEHDLLNDLWEYDPASGEWRWMSGANTVNQKGVYGALGVDASGNVPGARYGSVSWTDAGGHLWLFGGQGYDSVGNKGKLNDLWEYDPASGEWRWMSGSSTVGSDGVYGVQGAYASGNVPGAHEFSVSWTDAGGHLWLFGGAGYDSAGNNDLLNDLWEYDPASGEWRWMSGSSTVDSDGVYGAQGAYAASNVSGARDSSVSWTDAGGHLWLFGGWGYDSAGNRDLLNDLWEYQP